MFKKHLFKTFQVERGLLVTEDNIIMEDERLVKQRWSEFHHFVKHDYIKHIITWAQEHLIRFLLLNTVSLQMTAFCFNLRFTQHPIVF